MSNGLLDQLLDDPEAVFGDANIRTRFDTVAINITEADPVADPDPDPGLDDGEVELQRSDAENEIFDDENAIADALDEATGGDTIFVGPGTFEEELTITTADIELTCVSPNETTIVGQIVIESGGVVVSNFEIESGSDIDEIIEISVDVSDVTIVGCEFTVTTDIIRVIEIGDGDNITIDDCDFEVADGVTVERFIVVSGDAVDVLIVRCVFVGTVTVTTIEHKGTGEISECEFNEVELDEATLVVRVDDVTIEEIEIQIVEVRIQNEFEAFTSLSDAIDEANEGAEIIVQPGTYAEEGSISVATPDLEIRGPQAGTPGDDESRAPDDPDTEAIVENRVSIQRPDVIVDGFSLKQGTLIDPEVGSAGELVVEHNIINGVGTEVIQTGISSFTSEFDVSIRENFINNAGTGILASSQLDEDEFTDAVEIAANTIEAFDIGIDLTDTAITDGGIETIRANNTFRNTDTEVIPELADLFVDKDADEDEDDAFENVFNAIEAADPGDEIAVASGEYEEDGFITIGTEGIVLRSMEGREETTIKNESSIGIQADDVTIEGFEIVPQSAEGIFVNSDVDDATIEENAIDTTQNEFDIIGLDMRGNSATIAGNTITTVDDRDDIQIRGPDSSSDIPERINGVELDDFDDGETAFSAYVDSLIQSNGIESVGER